MFDELKALETNDETCQVARQRNDIGSSHIPIS